MYLPGHFAVTDPALLHEVIDRHNFATLVTVHDGAPVASHVPFLRVPGAEPHGSLLAHLARANPQWRDFASGLEALVIFQAEHAYITPSWYGEHPSVPTWNYMVVHAHGVPRLIQEEERVEAALRALVERHEAAFARPWAMDLPPDYLRKMIRGVVAFEMPIARLEGKFKLSQNRSAGDQRRVLEALDGSGDATERALAAAMAALGLGEHAARSRSE